MSTAIHFPDAPHNKAARASNAITIEDALKKMDPADPLVKMLADLAESNVWANFGKLNSHILRSILMTLMENSKLSNDAMFMVYFFCAAIKDKERIVRSMDTLPASVTGQPWFGPTKKFFTVTLVKYVSQEKAGKFATVHLPGTNPGLDIFCAMLQTPIDNMTKDTVLSRQTGAQVHFDVHLMAINRGHMEHLWNDMIQKSNNPDKTRYKKGFQADYYANQAGDEYYLLDVNGREIEPADTTIGYTEMELDAYVDTWKAHKKTVLGL